ncbi:P-loop NTPase family protein [Thermotalea metallivorans]|uniref:CobQ/CobB/MinD/ParA nucleotide binding domain-containing protein n=1 Tax=Thermotalea metallivorans TaxID=520762 RepID=A0A140L0C2_9FIRM|nr:hypothetical protein [Thermotalea metallivorans]KXG73997.1 hypothetical protein AN619_27020 [Thermotalea metallivorans]
MGYGNLLQNLKTAKFSLDSKFIMILSAEKEKQIDFLNELIKLNIQNFHFPQNGQFDIDDLKKWLLDIDKKLKDNEKYLFTQNILDTERKEDLSLQTKKEAKKPLDADKEKTEMEPDHVPKKKKFDYKEEIVEVKIIEKEIIKSKTTIVKEKDKHLVLFFSPNRSGASYVATNLAYMIEKRNKKVGICDLDFKNQSLFQYFFIDEKTEKEKINSLSNALKLGNKSIADVAYVTGDKDSIYLLTNKPSNREIHEKISIQEMIPVIDTLRSEMDFSILDYAFRDYLSEEDIYLFRFVDSVCIVTGIDYLSLESTKKTIQRLLANAIPFEKIIIVLNKYENLSYPSYTDILYLLEKDVPWKIDNQKIFKVGYDSNSIKSTWEGHASVVNSASENIISHFDILADYFIKGEKTKDKKTFLSRFIGKISPASKEEK